MAGFLYMLAGDTRPVDQRNVAEIGLGYAFPDGCQSREVSSSNISGKPGRVIGEPLDMPSGCELGFYADRQKWRAMPRVDDGPELWLGYWIDHLPGPEDLRRDTPIRTHQVKLDDGQFWEVPIIGHRESDVLVPDLPAYMDINDEGRRVRGELLAECQALWEKIAPLADKYFAHELKQGDEPTDDEQWQATVDLLQAVYRVDVFEIVALRLFLEQSDSIGTIWMIATEYEFLLQMIDAAQKKTSTPSAGNGEDLSVGKAAS
jgi:hypothetical protein